MNRARWLITVALGLAPMIGGMALQPAPKAAPPQAKPAPAAANGPQAKVTNPHGPIAIPCQNCHSYTSWKPIRSNPEFNHDQTRYPLRGMHEKVACTKCHTSMVFKNVSSQCADCHADIHRRQFGANCESCHTVKGWQVNTQSIKNHENRFPLVGAHALVECDQCHKNAAAGQFVGLSTACYSCHQQDFLTPVIDHVGLKFPTTCDSCHSMNSWFDAKFDHLQYTGYALTGAHATLSCTACHLNNVYKGTSAQCYSCHSADYTNTNNPPHAQLNLPRDCGTCHSTVDWSNATFDHALYAHWPLTGKHAAVTCAQCHTNNNYVSTPTDCFSCHQADFNGTTNPPHAAGGYPTNCTLCHTTNGWSPSSFDHNAVFPLTGAHITTQCTQCHVNNNYTSLPKDCFGCHSGDFNNSNNPSHVSLGLPTTCDTCHTTTNWLNAKFDHTLYAKWPLTGAHTTVGCAQCHVNNNYSSTSTDCYSCHQGDFNGTTNPNHVSSGFPTNCALCHTTSGWMPSSFNHAAVFPLTGAHATVACAQCHTNGNYSSLPKDCYGCHQSDFTTSNNPSHTSLNLPHTCDTCHTTTSWVNAKFDHTLYANYTLTGAHTTLACTQCHLNNNYSSTSTTCYSCHQGDFSGTKNPNHTAAGFPTNCALCHTTTGWAPSTFDHSAVFPLTGAHATVACATCHVNNNFTSLPTNCYGCHTKDFNGATNPNHVAAGFPTTCAVCHDTTAWTDAVFNHNNTPFPLTGAHTTVTCASCHVNNNYTTLPTDCYGCHTKDFNGTTNPNHVSAGFPTNCTLCHTTTAWEPSSFNHAAVFPLTGAHATVACAQCHTNNNYSSLPKDCYGCHQSDFTTSNNPSHVSLNLPHTCDTCHTTTSWANAKFDHTLYAHYTLTGAHTTLACTQCHLNNNYSSTSTACYGCHQGDFNGAKNPNHVSGGFPTNCAVCHTTTAWQPSNFNHAAVFPLTGAHATVACATCHVNNNYTTLPTDCYGCHTKDFNGTTNPNHVSSGFPTNCTLCHTTTAWQPSTFNHSTVFPLTGAHATVACATCHVNNNYTTLPTDCYGCHTKDFNGTTNPNHAAAGFPTTCAVCHDTTAWTDAVFNHNNTPFPLTGAHTTVACASCHVNNNYTTLPTDCYGCHTKDFTGTTNPNHVSAGFPTNCTLCHTTTAWSPSTFNHSAVFALTGAHATTSCASCHVNNNFTTLPTDCYGCHSANFNSATNPNHVAAGFPTTCAVCHDTTAWTDAVFNHNNTPFPLTGAHTTVTCASCHVNNNYTTLPTNCYGCHQSDFNGTTNPNHVASGFPTNCTLCHTTTTWTTSTFNHASVFPLTGAHANLQCASCHVNNNFTTLPTDCYGCHQSDWNGTNNPNHASAGFPTTCATCHSTTSWAGAVFNHNNTPFPLTGAHTTVPCSSCHINNVLAGTPTDCYSCHQADFNGTTNPNHVTAGFPTNCTLCHTTTTFLTSTFNHSSVFALTGAHATTACASCHVNNNYTTLPTDCYGCHSANYTSATNPNHVAAGFPTTCAVCHDTTAWTDAVFNHNNTAFPLTGAHTTVTCASCHVNNNYTTLPTACYGCHQGDFNGTTNPNHVASGFPTNCTLCHTTTSFLTSTFNHASVFPLTGAHANLQCAQCHTNNNYTTLPTNCYGCHQTDFTGTTNPNHVTVNFPTTCDTCHTTTDWTVATFNHALYANYALTGAHATLACAQCHVSNNFTSTSTACYSCHQADFTGTTNPNHVASGFPTDCSICHSTTTFQTSTFNHSSVFPLTGAHATLQCAQCHTNGNYTTLPTVCYGCHQADYTGTNNPNHAAAGFPTTCDTCHTTTSWAGATFNHNNTPFPLTGAHVNVACNLCHINNVFAGTPTDCYSCHTADYTGTTNPNHGTAGWPTTCTTCHTTTAWVPANLPASYHTFFSLSHGNANGVCTTCHTNSSDYSVFTCTGCHGGNNAANFHHPNVSGYQYLSTACYQCHKNGGGN